MTWREAVRVCAAVARCKVLARADGSFFVHQICWISVDAGARLDTLTELLAAYEGIRVVFRVPLEGTLDSPLKVSLSGLHATLSPLLRKRGYSLQIVDPATWVVVKAPQ